MTPIHNSSESGVAAIMVAGALIFLFGMAALAVDASDFYQTARVGQTTADLACLAGVAELDEGDEEAIEAAVAFTQANWPEMASVTPIIAGDTGTLSDGNGNIATYEAGYNGDDNAMRLTVTERNPTTFGRVLGTEFVDVVQEAACKREIEPTGGGVLPIGVLPGAFDGNLFTCADKHVGNCGGLNPDGTGASIWADQLSEGVNTQLDKHNGNRDDPDPDTHRDSDVKANNPPVACPSTGPCNGFATETGNMEGKFVDGIEGRLSKSPNCFSDTWNCDSRQDVLGSDQTLHDVFGSDGDDAPPGWEESLYGDYEVVGSNVYYHNAEMAKCESPRFGAVPIVTNNLDWDIDDEPGVFSKSGKKNVKVVGFYYIYIREPDEPGEASSHDGPIEADIIWFGPNARCNGVALSLKSPVMSKEVVKLIES